MDIVIATAYVLSVYILLPLYLWQRWERQQARRDPVHRRGIAKIERELRRRQQGLIDADDPSGVRGRDAPK